MDRKIVLATSNPGKLAEIKDILQNTTDTILPQRDFDIEDAEETGLTFIENALIKARHACKQTGLAALADDSGLEVDALSGAPGIYSARFAGANASDQDNIDKLLADLQGVPPNQRNARFWCVMVFLRHDNDPAPILCQGSWQGRIALARTGDNGFGYDPVFLPTGFTRSAAQLRPEEKNQISHRAQALSQLRSRLV